MSGAYGKNIVATRAGTVILSSLESESGTGYGDDEPPLEPEELWLAFLIASLISLSSLDISELYSSIETLSSFV